MSFMKLEQIYPLHKVQFKSVAFIGQLIVNNMSLRFYVE